jgi:AcrR family transcriptional regulator
MDDVARAADVSPQGLYVHLASKKDLFREIHQGLSLHLHEARLILSDEAQPIGQRLIDGGGGTIANFTGPCEQLK